MISTRFKKKLAFLGVILLLIVVPLSANAQTNICNRGNSWLYMVTMGTSTDITNRGIIEGFKPISPGSCAPVFPFGINRVYVSFFKYDKEGVINNVQLVPEGARNHTPKEQIHFSCVLPQKAFRFNGSWNEIKQRFTPPCQTGSIQAKTSLEMTRGSDSKDINNNIYHQDIQNGQPWGAKYGPKRRLQPIWEGNVGSGHFEANKIKESEARIIAATVQAVGKYIDEVRKKEAARRQQKLEIYKRRQAEYKRRVKEAEKRMARPDNRACTQFIDKGLYKTPGDLTIAGIRVGMDTETALDALLCNGFTAPPEVIARSGGIKNYMQKRHVVKFQKQGPSGYGQVLELENRGGGNKTNNSFSVISVRLRFIADHVIDEHEWTSIKQEFQTKYNFGGFFSGVKKFHQNHFIHYRFSKNTGFSSLQLNQVNNYNRPLRKYTISMM